MLKSNGPNIDPWCIAEIILFHGLNFLLTRTRYWLFIKELFIKESASFWKPYAPNFAINKSWFTVQKAFEKSMNMARTKPTLPRLFFHFSRILIKQCWVLWTFLNPVSKSDSLPSMKISIWVYMILSNNFGMWSKTLVFLV